TKLGMVVAGSFLGLVGVVLVCKFNEEDPEAAVANGPVAAAVPSAGKADGKPAAAAKPKPEPAKDGSVRQAGFIARAPSWPGNHLQEPGKFPPRERPSKETPTSPAPGVPGPGDVKPQSEGPEQPGGEGPAPAAVTSSDVEKELKEQAARGKAPLAPGSPAP